MNTTTKKAANSIVGKLTASILSTAAVAALTCAPALAGVLVVGDSLEVLTSPYLQQYLPSASLTINAEGGYNSLQIYKLFQESYDPSQSVLSLIHI